MAEWSVYRFQLFYLAIAPVLGALARGRRPWSGNAGHGGCDWNPNRRMFLQATDLHASLSRRLAQATSWWRSLSATSLSATSTIGEP